MIIIPSKRLKSSTRPIDRTLIGTITPGQSESESDSNEIVIYIPKTPRLEPVNQIEFSVIPRIQDSFKYCYQMLIILFNIIHSFAQWLQVLLSDTNNSI